MQELEPILTQSIQEYERVFAFLQDMDKEIGTASPVQLLELNENLAVLQGQATRTDQVLLRQAGNHAVQTAPLLALMERRRRIVGDILLLNERLTAKAAGVKSHIAFELKKLRHGLSAMNGYRQPQNSQGRIVNSSS